MNINDYNSKAWDSEVDRGNQWTVPVSPQAIANARKGHFAIRLTPKSTVPMDWFGSLHGADVLCLASGGGQQGPILAAAGANVTVFDNSRKQLEQDQMVAARESLDLRCLQGDMTLPWNLYDESFDLIFHPCSNCFVEHIRPIWRECHRVLKNGGTLLAGFANPAQYIFDQRKAEQDKTLVVRHSVPYSELTDLSHEERQYFVERKEPLLFGHTLEDQIGGQIDAGFTITGFFEDRNPNCVIADLMPTYVATRSLKASY